MASELGTRLYVDGKWVEATGEREIEVLNPATEEVIARVPEGSPADVEAAIVAARRAFDEGPWPRMAPQERGRHLSRLADALQARKDEFVDILAREAGVARVFGAAIQFQIPLDHLQDMADRVLSSYPFLTAMPPTIGANVGQGVVVREPTGVVSAITPFNYPFYVNIQKMSPSLAAGNTLVLKPSPYTPLTALKIAEVVEEVDLPRGVVNVVTCGVDGAQVMTTHPAVDIVTFTGSEAVGAQISAQAAPGIKRVLLELGGKSANIICDDATLDRAIPYAVLLFTRHSGQGCGAMPRIVVQRSIHDEVVERLVDRMAKLKIGDPNDADTDMGPVIRDTQRARIERYVALGREEGAKVVFGGGRPAGFDRGFWVEPTLFVDAKSSMRICQEEIFGPVGAVIPFDTDDEAVAIANDSRYGLSGAVWSADTKRAYAMALRLESGGVYVNGGGGGSNPYGPFGGYKKSGFGREYGVAGLEEYLETKSIWWGVAPG
jgi:aldehyde dehydrogenase (NAD+)